MRNTVLFALTLLFISFLSAQEPFITVWRVEAGDTEITIPAHPEAIYNYDIDWENDGNWDEFEVEGNSSHDFGAEGVFEVAIRGGFPRIYFDNGGDKEKIINIDQWGDIVWLSMESAFFGCKNLNSTAIDIPNLSLVSNFSFMFSGASSFNHDIGNWDVSGATTMKAMFEDATDFNQNIGSWDVSNVTDMSGMFSRASKFNKDIGNWDVSNVTDMFIMFGAASSFNRNIGDWDVSNVRDMEHMFSQTKEFNQDIGEWDVSSVRFMSYMFHEALKFNRDIGNWDVSSAENMGAMFMSASAFNQNLDNWDVSSCDHFVSIFKRAKNFNQSLESWDLSGISGVNRIGLSFSGIDVENYDATLKGWLMSGIENVHVDADSLFYCNAVSERSDLVESSWSFIGDSYNCFTSTKDFSRAEITISPNPSQDFIRISADEIVIGDLNITNIQGQEVMQLNNINILDPISIKELASGTYFINVIDANQKEFVGKFVKM